MFEVGSLVRWIEPYADGIAKDAGTGIVLKAFSQRWCEGTRKTGIVLKSFSHKIYNKSITTYEVYRTKHNDKMRFEEYELEKIDD